MTAKTLPDSYRRVAMRHDELRDSLSAPDIDGATIVSLSRELTVLEPVVTAIHALEAALSEQADLEAMIAEGDDDELVRMAKDDLHALGDQIPMLERQIRIALLPKDAADDGSAILEVRAGTGGDEAALFAGELFQTYQRYAQLRGWRWETLELAETELGGLKEAVAAVGGHGVFARLKFESGVHRVQRVPATESQGRIHTSAATVAVLPDAEEVEVDLDDKDLRIDVFRASGAGGQHVNKTESAVRITHLPSGIVVSQQDEKSQHKNKAKALKILRARLYDLQRSQVDSVRAADRKSQVGSGDRSERIRTYNFPQGRVSDHRINLTLYKIEAIMTGEAMDEVIEPLIAADQAERLAALDA